MYEITKISVMFRIIGCTALFETLELVVKIKAKSVMKGWVHQKCKKVQLNR